MKPNKLARSLALIGLGSAGLMGSAWSQAVAGPRSDHAVQNIGRVEITGSSIRRLGDEGALPLEVITAKQMQQRGQNTAEDLLRSLSVNANNAVSNNSVFGDEADRLAGGGAYANLRGLGPSQAPWCC